MLKCSVGFRAVGTVALMLCASNAFAQATRTWVSGVGDDVNPCSRTAPCKTFAGAISKTAVGGEINAIDPGGFGAVTITKSVTIDGGAGQIAGILSAGTTGVTINAAGATVTLRNLDINGAGTGIHGVRVLLAGTVQVENCVIQNVTQKGIEIANTAGTVKVLINDCHILNNANIVNGGGVNSKPAAGATVQLVLDRVRIHNTTIGVRVDERTSSTISNSSITGSLVHGIVCAGLAAPANVNLDSCIISNNTSSGMRVEQAQATIRYGNCMINNNALGLDPVAGGALITYLNNRVGGNTVAGAPTGNIPQQ